MALDRHVAERRRFARLLGLADEHGSGLPVGSSDGDEPTARREDPDDRNAADRSDAASADTAPVTHS